MEQSDDRAHQQPEAEVEVVDSSEDTSLLDLKQFANALRVPGMLHVADNCLGHILQSCKCWDELLRGLRLVEVLLCRPLYRERFLFICVGTKRASDENLNKWSHSLKGLRWQAVLEFTLALLPLETLLRQLGCMQSVKPPVHHVTKTSILPSAKILIS